jgi:hypothetical protein
LGRRPGIGCAYLDGIDADLNDRGFVAGEGRAHDILQLPWAFHHRRPKAHRPRYGRHFELAPILRTTKGLPGRTQHAAAMVGDPLHIVVLDDPNDRQTVLRRRDELHAVHGEAGVAHDCKHGAPRFGQGSADRRGSAVTHRTESEIEEEALRCVQAKVMDVPQHMPADVGKNDGLVGQNFLQIATPTGGTERNGSRRAKVGILVAVVTSTQTGRRAPSRSRNLTVANGAVQMVDELHQNRLGIADERDVDRVISPDSVDVDVELQERLEGTEPGVPVERRSFAERRPYREEYIDILAEEQIACVAVTGKTEDAQRELVIFGEQAFGARRGGHPRRQNLGEDAQVLLGPRDPDP